MDEKENINFLWESILEELKQIYSKEIFEQYFASIQTKLEKKENKIYLFVKENFIKNRINKVYLSILKQIAKKKGFQNIDFIILKQNKEKQLIPEYKINNLNEKYKFKNFILGSSNELAFKAAKKMTMKKIFFNPLYIFSDIGLGKTHLLQAIGHEIQKENQKQKILYTKGDVFIEDFITLLNKEKMEEFNQKYRNIDVLLIDDIQMLAGANKTQSEFFKLFDFLFLNNKKIIITSDKPAFQLKNIMKRLTSRFEAGLSVDIQKPDLKHRIDILKSKIKNNFQEKKISNEVLNFIANSFQKNIRELEGALNRLVNYAEIYNKEIDINITNNAFQNLLNNNNKEESRIENKITSILEVISQIYQISITDLISKKNNKKLRLPRNIAIYLIKKKYDFSFKKIGLSLGNREYSTILQAFKKIKEVKEKDQIIQKIIQKIEKKI